MQHRVHRSIDNSLGNPPKSPFIRPHLNGNDADKKSRPGAAFLGTSSSFRIWAIFICICVIFVITRLFSGTSSSSTAFYNQDALHPINHFNASQSAPAPFPFCPVHGPGDIIGNKYGPHSMAKSRLHLGSGARIQRLLHRAMSGQPITISVLGGSIASCHGSGDEPLAASCWPARFFMWWNSVFPHPATQLTNGARRRTDSSYFAFCHGHHLPDEADLVILDFDTEDQTDSQALEHFELLVRSILNRRDSPALLILGHFSPQFQTAFGFHGPELQHSIVAQYYDVPHISIKGAMYQDYLTDPDEYRESYHADPVLANANGHELLGDFLISYFQAQICKGWDAAWGRAFDVPLLSTDGNGASGAEGLFGGIRVGGGVGMFNGAGDGPAGRKAAGKAGKGSDQAYAAFRIPSGRLSSRPSDLEKLTEAEPFCVAADDLINPLPPSLFYGSGWHVYHPENDSGSDDNRHYWYSTQPTSKLRVPLKVGAGDIAVYYLEEGKSVEESTSIECWVDDNYPGKVLLRNDGNSGKRPKLVMIDHGVTTGPHFVECQLLEALRAVEPFKILGIFAT